MDCPCFGLSTARTFGYGVHASSERDKRRCLIPEQRSSDDGRVHGVFSQKGKLKVINKGGQEDLGSSGI